MSGQAGNTVSPQGTSGDAVTLEGTAGCQLDLQCPKLAPLLHPNQICEDDRACGPGNRSSELGLCPDQRIADLENDETAVSGIHSAVPLGSGEKQGQAELMPFPVTRAGSEARPGRAVDAMRSQWRQPTK